MNRCAVVSAGLRDEALQMIATKQIAQGAELVKTGEPVFVLEPQIMVLTES